MSYNDIATLYPKYHEFIVLLGAHVNRDFPPVAEDASGNRIPHAERDHLLELLAQGWEDLRQGNISKGQEQAVRKTSVVLPAQADHETETHSYGGRVRGELIEWDYAQTRMTKAAQDALRGVSEDA